jgi:hypothetical protein
MAGDSATEAEGAWRGYLEFHWWWAFYQFASVYGSRSVKLKLDTRALKA